MNVVSNNYMLNYLRKISIFKIDLGFNLKGPVKKNPSAPTQSVKIRDEFVKKYEMMSGILLNKYGEIGSLKFYEDNSIKGLEMHIYDGEKIFEIISTPEDIKQDAAVFLTNIIRNIEEGVYEKTFEIPKNITISTTADDIGLPDMKMPTDQYIEALINRRRLLEKTNR